MSRFLLLLFFFLGLAIYYILRNSVLGRRRKEFDRRSSNQSQTEEHIVTCAHCGVYLPESECVCLGDLHYCSQDHCRLGPPR